MNLATSHCDIEYVMSLHCSKNLVLCFVVVDGQVVGSWNWTTLLARRLPFVKSYDYAE
jgi:hypothetical protein